MSRRPNQASDTFQFLVALPRTWAQHLDAIAAENGSSRMSLVRSAIETFLSEHGGERLAFELPDELRLDLAALSEAMDGALAPKMIAKALEQYIESMRNKNAGINTRFVAERERIKNSVQGGRGKVIEFKRTRMSQN